MANQLNDTGELEEAIDAYNNVISIKHDFYKAYNNLGKTLKEKGRLDEAIEAYKRASL